jgi:hypothetical protein
VNRNIIRALAVATVGTLLAGGLAACSTAADAPDFLLVRYSKEVGGGISFKECVQPSRKTGATYNDQNFPLAISLRTWNVRAQGGDSNVPVQTGTKRTPVPGSKSGETRPGPDVKVYTKTEFYLNTDCGKANEDGISTDKDSPVVRFWENTGRRYGVATDGTSAQAKDGEGGFNTAGWNNMLINTLVTAEEKAVRSSSRNYGDEELDANIGGVWGQMEQQMSKDFAAELNASIGGGDYFCGPQYRRDPKTGQAVKVVWTENVPDPAKPGTFKPEEKSGTCPPVRISITDVILADANTAAARANVAAAELNRQANNINTDSKVETANKLRAAGKEGVEVQRQQTELQLEQERTKQVQACAANPNCTVVVGGGTGVIVGAGK